MRFAELGPQSLSNLEFKVDKELQEGMKIGLNINSMPAAFWPCLLHYYVCGLPTCKCSTWTQAGALTGVPLGVLPLASSPVAVMPLLDE